MELKVHQPAGGAAAANVATVSGEVDLHSAPGLRDQLGDLLAGANPSLILDLNEVGFLDSTGLGALVAARASATEHGGQLALVCTQPRILKLFTITGLNSVFKIHSSVDDALANIVA
jgi:anti-sigma B factor antagonist